MRIVHNDICNDSFVLAWKSLHAYLVSLLHALLENVGGSQSK